MSFDNVEAVRKLDFFEPLDEKILRSLARQCFDKEFDAGDFIVRQGEPGLGLYFILSGHVRVEIENAGVRSVVAELGAHDSVGELSIIDDKARSASVVCTEPTKCLLLTRDSFSKLVNKHPQIAIQMVRALAARLRATNARIAQPPAPVPSAVAPAAVVQAGNEEACGSGLFSPLSLPGQVFDVYRGAKDKVKDVLVDAFTPIYAARVMTRFSMAVIGCPVTVRPAEPGSHAAFVTADDVKVCFFPGHRHHVLGIDAWDDGEVSISVLRPGGAVHLRAAIRGNDRWRLHIPPGRAARRGNIWLETPNGERIGSDDCG